MLFNSVEYFLLLTTTVALYWSHPSIVWRQNVLLLSSLLFYSGSEFPDWQGNAFIGDLSNVLFANIGEGSVSGSIPESVFALFQMTFAIITPALIVGAYVERIKFGAVLLFSGLWLLLVYAPVCHWIWGGGWLAQMGVLDFAGGLVVHATAGTYHYTTPLPMTEMLTALQTGLIEAIDVPPLFAMLDGSFQRAPYMTDIRWAPVMGCRQPVVRTAIRKPLPCRTGRARTGPCPACARASSRGTLRPAT